jgi:transposase
VRAREDTRADLMRVRHRLSKLLLRQGFVHSGGTPWTCAHEEWLRRHRFADVHLKAAFDHGFDAVLAATAARERLDEQIMVVAASPRFADPVNRLGCLRGISALTGLALTVEIGEWSRFTGSPIGAYVGLVPSEYSSGNSRVQGSITKAGMRMLSIIKDGTQPPHVSGNPPASRPTPTSRTDRILLIRAFTSS